MKRLKLFTVALTLLMGMTFTSCLNSSDDSSAVDQMHFALVKNFMGLLYFEDATGTRLTPTSESVAVLEANSSSKISDFNFGMIYYNWLEGQEPIEGQLKDAYDIALMGFQPFDYATAVEATTAEDIKTFAPETAPVTTVNIQGMKPFQFNPEVIVVPILYYMENKAETLKQHKFTLACPVEEIGSGDRSLTFYLHHDRGTDEKREVQNMTYYAYNIADIISIFKSKTGSAPFEIIVKVHETGEYGNSENIPANYTDYSFDYKEVINK